MKFHFKKNQELASLKANLPLRAIALDLYDLIYSKPYPGLVERTFHGIAHVSRASIIGAAGYNIMVAAGVEGTRSLTEHEKSWELLLVQIALLLHDSGREGDGEDLWDNDSALNVYHYLIERLGIDAEEARCVAEAMANKDWPSKPYQKLVLTEQGAVFQEQPDTLHNPFTEKTNRLRLAIHFGDCIEIVRVGKSFDLKYLSLANQQYPEAQQKIIENNVFKIYQDELVVLESYQRNRTNQTGYDTENAYDLAIQDTNTLTHTLAYFYPDPRGLELDPEANIPWVKNEPPDGYLLKRVGATERAWPEFVSHMIHGRPLEFRASNRNREFTSRQVFNKKTGEHDIQVIPVNKNNRLRKPLLDSTQKNKLTRATSMGYYTKKYKPVALDLNESLNVGIRIPLEGAVIHRIFQFDSATHYRNYDNNCAISTLQHARQSYVRSFNELMHPKTKKKVTSRDYLNNEIMASIAWDEENDDCRIMIFTDNMESRLYAQARAIDIALAVNTRRIKQGKTLLADYRPAILFYPSLADYPIAEQANDIEKILSSADAQDKDLASVACAIQDMNGINGVSIDQRIHFLTAHGKYFDNKLNLLLLTHVMHEFSHNADIQKKALQAINPHAAMELIQSNKVPLSQKMIDTVFETNVSSLEFTCKLTDSEWESLMANPYVQQKIQNMLAISSNLGAIIFYSKDYQDIKKIKILLDKIPSFDVNQPDASGMSALGHAFKEHHDTLLLALIDKGGDIKRLVDLTLNTVNVLDNAPRLHDAFHTLFDNKSDIVSLCIPHLKQHVSAIILNNHVAIDDFIKNSRLSDEVKTDMLLKLGFNHLSKKIHFANTLARISCLIPEQHYPQLINCFHGIYLHLADSENFRNLILKSPYALRLFLFQRLNKTDQKRFLENLYGLASFALKFKNEDQVTLFMKTIDKDSLRSRTKDYFFLKILLNELPFLKSKEFLLRLGSDHLKKLSKTSSYNDLAGLFEALPITTQFDFIKISGLDGSAIARVMDSAQELGLFLRELPAAHWIDFLSQVGGETLRRWLPDGKYLYVVMTKIPKNDAPMLIEALNKALDSKAVKRLLAEPTCKPWMEEILTSAHNPQENKNIKLDTKK